MNIKMLLSDTALSYLQAGLSVIPTLLETKQPTVKWKAYQTERPDKDDIKRWFADNDKAIAVICGKVSGSLEIIDIDNHFGDADLIFSEWSVLVQDTAPGLFERLVIEQTQSGGYHIIYRAESIAGNLKLARRRKADNKIDTVIETRGEGGYALVAPTDKYNLIQGSLTDINLISDDERELLIAVGRSFTEIDEANVTTPSHTNETLSNKPGAIFNEQGDIKDTLTAHGWTLVNIFNGIERWRRPGKQKGISATFGAIPGKFYVFSSNADPFESGRTYDRFAVESILNHNSNFKECAKVLAMRGFGELTNGHSNGLGSSAVSPSGKLVSKEIPGVIPDPNKPAIFKQNDIFANLQLPETCIFWYEHVTGSKKSPVVSIKINKSKLINYLEHHGFYKYWLDQSLSTYIHIVNNIVSQETTETIIDFLKSSIMVMPDDISSNFTNLDLWEALLQKIHVVRAKDFLETLTAKHLNFIQDTKHESFFFFKNCVVRTNNQEETVALNYDELDGYIWKEQIIDHNLNLIPFDKEDDTPACIFGQFLEKVCSYKNKEFPSDRTKRVLDEERLAALCSGIGYLQHTFKDPSVTKAVILCEEKIAKDNESNGRTGKGVTAYALGKTRKRKFFNGKGIDFKDKFLFQSITPDIQFMFFDDVRKNFDFESLFSILTDGITVEPKGGKPRDIPFDQTPKVLITTNDVLSNDSDSFKARKFEIEFTDYFSADYTPVDEFGGNMFEKGWAPDDPEWDRFYSFMIHCTTHYLVMGLMSYSQANLAERKLLASVPEEFIELAAEKLEDMQKGQPIYKDNIYEDFISRNKIYGPNGKRAVSQKLTTRWFNQYLDFKQINYADSRDSSGERKKYWALKNENLF